MMKRLPMRCFQPLAAALTGLLLSCGTAAAADNPRQPTDAWAYFQEIPKSGEQSPGSWCDTVLTSSVFDGARTDLGDLRLYDAAGKEVPYALRVLQPQDIRAAAPAKEFNRTSAPGEASELVLDLGNDPPEHNEVVLDLSGMDFRRHAQLDGSDDAKSWRKLVEKELVHFEAGGKTLDDEKLGYPISRFRYLRVRVQEDPLVDKRPVEIGKVEVLHTVHHPGEFLTLPVKLGPREAVRTPNGPGSGWRIDLGGKNIPSQEVLADVADAEFGRDVTLKAFGFSGDETAEWFPFRGSWQRRAGDKRVPMKAEYAEQSVGSFELMVTDNRNPPLTIEAVSYRQAIRQLVFSSNAALNGPLRLYYGNPQAEPPHYDLERTLPKILDKPPARLTLGARQANPRFVADLPLTDRWPWLIYVVLGSACAALGLIILNLGKTAMVQADATLEASAQAHVQE
jgi:hypothetical protein